MSLLKLRRWRPRHLVCAAALLFAYGCDARVNNNQPAPSAVVATAATASATSSAAANTATSALASATTAAPKAVDAEPWLSRTLRDADPRWGQWLGQAEELRLQVLVTVVDPESQDWKVHEFRVDKEYFYPASAIKTFLAVEALRSTSRTLGSEIPLGTRILRCRINKSGCKPPREDRKKDEAGEPKVPDEKKKHRKLRIGAEIRKMLSYSDNDSFNRLYDIVGHRELNEGMAELSFDSVRFHHKMNSPAPRSKKTPRVTLLPGGKPAIRMPLRDSDFVPAATKAARIRVGTAHNDAGKIKDEPLDFAQKMPYPSVTCSESTSRCCSLIIRALPSWG